MVVVGADVHKRTHTFVAVDDVGRAGLGDKVVAAPRRRVITRHCSGRVNSSVPICCGALRTVGRLSARLSVICSAPAKRSCGWRRQRTSYL